MIVDDAKVEIALGYLNLDPHPIALAHKAVTDTGNRCKELFSIAFLNASGTENVRRATAEIEPKHIAAKEREADAIMSLQNERAKMRGAEMLIEAWRSEQANVRAAERLR